MIYIPKFRDIFLTAPCMSRAAGWFKFVGHKVDAHGQLDGRSRVIADWFPNLITDAGLNRLGTKALYTCIETCEVGSGNTPPAVSDTNLVSKVARNNSIQAGTTRGKVIVGSPPTIPITEIHDWVLRIYRFNAGVAAGTLAEVCVRETSAAGNVMYSRALILDANTGLPTTITVLPDEVLDVHYRHRLYFDLADHPYSFVISGVSYGGTARLADYGGQNSTNNNSLNTEYWCPATLSDTYYYNNKCYNGAIQGIHQEPSGTSLYIVPNNSYIVDGVYSSGTLKNNVTFNIGLNDANFTAGQGGGWTAMKIAYLYGWTQFSISPKIPKDATKVMTLNVEYGPWGRYTPP